MKIAALVFAGVFALVSMGAYAHMHRGEHSGSPGAQGPSENEQHSDQRGRRMHGHMRHHHMHQRGRCAATSPSGAHSGHSSSQLLPKGDQSPASLAFEGANRKMHGAMSIEFSGDADLDFVNGMIPHHRGAVDMAKIVLAFGKDPEIKKLAQEILNAQESEIALMEAWRKARKSAE